MIIFTKDGTEGVNVPDLGFAVGRGPIGRIALRLTRHLRAVNAEKYISSGHRLLDIGCGDGYFLKRVKCEERYGIDRLLGEEVRDTLDFGDAFFDYVTMLAVIEHLTNPDAILKEIHRILKPGGKFVFTTPKKQGEVLIWL